MRISLLIDNLSAGGKERQFLYLATELSKAHDIQVLVFNKDLFYKEIVNMNLQLCVFAPKSKFMLRTAIKANKALFSFKPEIIHSWDNLSQLLIIPYQLYSKVRIVNGSIRYGNYLRRSILSKLIKALSFRTAHVIVSNSTQGLRVEKMLQHKKSRVIRNGLDTELMKSSDSKLLIGNDISLKFKIVMVGRFESAKDYESYITVAKLITSNNKNIGFYCIGTGKNLDYYKFLSGDLENKNIFFLGNRKDIHSILGLFDIGVLLSNTNGHAEGASNAIMEYMAAGLPVIATNAGGNPELVVDQKSGFLVPPFDIHVMANRIQELISNETLRISMGKYGKRIISEQYSLDKMVNTYLSLYIEQCDG